MPRITKYSRWQAQPKENFFSQIWNWFLSFDKFTRTFIVSGMLILIAVPGIVAQQTGFFTHAGGSVFTTCVAPPPGFSQEQLDMISQSRKVNWCRTLAQNIIPAAQDTPIPQDAPSSDNNIFSGVISGVEQFFLMLRKMFVGY